MSYRFPWHRLSDEQLLDMRICDLPIKIKGSFLEPHIKRLYSELNTRGIRFKPHVWLSEEWFSPDGVPGIAIPFYLAHPRLVKLERKQMLEVEGGSDTECMRILRHEAGHSLDTAYRLHFKRRQRELFGSFAQPYPDFYKPKPKSRKFVLHLPAWYAQAHPAEDFAETFAVWLTPRSQWRRRYKGWPALRKLEYIDELMAELDGTKPRNRVRTKVEPLSALRITLREHYRRKRERYDFEWPTVYDRDLYRIFSDDPAHSSRPSAASFIRRVRREVRQIVAEGTGVHQYTIDHVLENMINRCQRTEAESRNALARNASTCHDCIDGAGNERFAFGLSSHSRMTFEPRKKLRIIVLCHEDLVPPDSLNGLSDKEKLEIKTEFDVISTLKKMGHEVYPIGLYNQLNDIGNALLEHKPHIAFNLLEEFHGYPLYDQHVVSYLELMKQAYTGCNPRGMTLAHDKALTKMILSYHRILVPNFAVFPMNRKVKRPKRLTFPILVKSISEEGSVGIAQASIVHDDEKLTQRVEFIHRQNNTAAIAEQYIKGREIYVGVIGNQNIQTYSPWELVMEKLPDGAENIATLKVKWDPAYQEKVGVATRAADLTPEQHKTLERLSKRIYRYLFLSGYARLDYRMTEDGQFYLLEANPNPQIAHKEDFADSAEHSGVPYDQLLQKIMTVGLNYAGRGLIA